MKVAVVGSRGLAINTLAHYLPEDTTQIISGGARGIDLCARDYALSNHIKLTEILPNYARFGRSAPLHRNITIIEQADFVLAFWDGVSPGTKHVIQNCEKRNIPLMVFFPNREG